MSTDPFDREIRRRLKDYKSPVPEHLLDNVLKRRKRRAPFFGGGLASRAMLAAIALLLAFGLWYGLNRSEKQEIHTKDVPKEVIPAGKQQKHAQANLSEPTIPTPPAATNETKSASAENQKTPSPSKPDKASQAANAARSKSSTPAPLKADRQENKTTSPSLAPATAQTETPINKDAASTQSVMQTEVPSLSSQTSEGPFTEDQKLRESQADIAFVPTALLPALPESHLRSDLQFHLKPECAKFQNKERRFYFDLLASPDIALRSIRPKEEQSVPLALKRLETETIKQSYTLGARLTTVSPHGWSLRSGFQYTQINERFAYEGETEERIIIKIIYDDQGQIIGTDTVYESYTPYYASNNVYRLFDIPLMAGYQIDMKRFALIFHGGLHFNLFLSPEGTFFSPEMQPVAFSEIPAFRKRASLSLAAAFGINYRLTPRLELLFEPRFRYFLSPFTTKDYLLEQQYMLIGLNLGARVQL